jgi:hypothetical protein
MRVWTGIVILMLAASIARAATYDANINFDDPNHDVSAYNADQTGSSAVQAGSTNYFTSPEGVGGYAYAAASQDALKGESDAGGGGDAGGFTSTSNASFTAQGLTFSGTGPNVTTAINLVLNGTILDQAFQSDESASISSTVTVTYSVTSGATVYGSGSGSYTVSVSGSESGSDSTSGDFILPGTLESFGYIFNYGLGSFNNTAVTTNSFTAPVGVPLTLYVQFTTQDVYASPADGNGSGSADFQDTLELNANGVFENIYNDPNFNANAPDAGVVNNGASPTPEPSVPGLFLVSAVIALSLRRVRRNRIRCGP